MGSPSVAPGEAGRAVADRPPAAAKDEQRGKRRPVEHVGRAAARRDAVQAAVSAAGLPLVRGRLRSDAVQPAAPRDRPLGDADQAAGELAAFEDAAPQRPTADGARPLGRRVDPRRSRGGRSGALRHGVVPGRARRYLVR